MTQPHPTRLMLVIGVVVGLLSATVMLHAPVFAAESPKNKGLQISPIREYTAIDVNESKNGNFTLANYNDSAIDVTLSVEEFSVSDYAYDYEFHKPKNNWVKLGLTSLTLSPGENKRIGYQITIPKGSSPGGQYYTIFATASTQSGLTKEKVRVGTLLYTTVNGNLVRTASLVKSEVPKLVFGRSIPLGLDVKNTGNVHYFAHTSARLHGLFTQNDAASASYLLMPGTIRSLDTTLKSPLLPGFYRINYGYKTDALSAIQRSQIIIYLPPWTLVVLAFVGWLMFRGIRQRKRVTSE